MSTVWIVFLPLAFFFAWLFFLRLGSGKPCPDCGQPRLMLQSPLTVTRRQRTEASYLCSNCGCETDTTGRKMASGNGSQRRSLVVGVALLIIATLPAVVLMTMLLQR